MKKIYVPIIITFLMAIILENITFATNTISNEEKERKSNKYLSSLEVVGYDISPDFNKNTLDYYVVINKETTSLQIQANPEIDGAIVNITGNNKLTKNENNINIRVTAIDGTSKVYTITAVKEVDVNLQLTSLESTDIEIEPQFNKDKYYYKASLEDTELRSININAKSNNENANIEIIGADNLEDGNNLINIVLTNGNEKTIYQIDLEVDFLGEKEKEIDNVITRLRKIINYTIIGIIALIILIIVIIIISVIVKKAKKNKKEKNKKA